jgi:AAA15 family ATPase/GTPase
LTKPVLDPEGNIINYVVVDLERDESDGTQKYYNLIGGLYEVFEKGGIFVSDEIDSNFHPSLLIQVIRLFQDKEVNKTNAQLLFTSHDTNLMNPDLMRRDQFYFTEKNRLEQTTLYSLADLRGIRNNSDFARQYLAGYYGALPQLGAYLNAVDHDTNMEKNNCN